MAILDRDLILSTLEPTLHEVYSNFNDSVDIVCVFGKILSAERVETNDIDILLFGTFTDEIKSEIIQFVKKKLSHVNIPVPLDINFLSNDRISMDHLISIYDGVKIIDHKNNEFYYRFTKLVNLINENRDNYFAIETFNKKNSGKNSRILVEKNINDL